MYLKKDALNLPGDPLSGTKRTSNNDKIAALHNVRFWHKADIAEVLNDVCFWG
jgi:hypothetical protein